MKRMVTAYAWDSDFEIGVPPALALQCDVVKMGHIAFASLRDPHRAMMAIKDRGKGVFLDMKYQDTPHTVAQAVNDVTRWGIADYITIMSYGASYDMIGAACDAARRGAQKAQCAAPKIAAVTMLSSMSLQDFMGVMPFMRATTKEWENIYHHLVLYNAQKAMRAGAQALVVPVPYIAQVRRIAPTVEIIATGIVATHGETRHGQAHCATAHEAVHAGATMLVLGRVLSEAPPEVADAFLREVQTLSL